VGGLLRAGTDAAAAPIRLPYDGPILGKHRQEVRALLAEVEAPGRTDDGRVIPVTCNMAAHRRAFRHAVFDETVRPPVEETDWLIRSGATTCFVPGAWLWHRKPREEMTARRLTRTAWNRGLETGWWTRTRQAPAAARRARMLLTSGHTLLRSLGHAALHRCWGGVLTGVGELGRISGLLGWSGGDRRSARSWR
jgi:hypothetical protein